MYQLQRNVLWAHVTGGFFLPESDLANLCKQIGASKKATQNKQDAMLTCRAGI